MGVLVRFLFMIAVVVLGIVSIWTTYVSLHDSILPEPVVDIPLWDGMIWKCSIMALGMSVAIGIMLFALKVAVIGEHKRLSIVGVIGMTIVAFISISFNLDVLYRTADRDFFLRYSNDTMRSVYEGYLAEVTTSLTGKRTELLRQLAKQEGELDAEVKGLRKAPAGYGQHAKEEDYKLTLLQKTTQVELDAVEQAIKTKEQADEVLNGTQPANIEDIDRMQQQLRVICKDLAGPSGVMLPNVVRLESPLFAVFSKIFDLKSLGLKEVFLVIIAFLMDLGDIIGYTLVPNRKRKPAPEEDYEPLLPLSTLRPLPGPETAGPPALVEIPSIPNAKTPVPEDTNDARAFLANDERRQRFRIRPR